MRPETKAQAKKKLANFRVMVGYPDKWRDYSGLQIVRGDAYGNWQRAGLFEYRRNVAKLGQPVDRGEWFMTPQTVNALFAPEPELDHLPGGDPGPDVLRPERGRGGELRRSGRRARPRGEPRLRRQRRAVRRRTAT